MRTDLSRPRLEALTSIRFFAALHVVFLHNVSVFDDAPAPVFRFMNRGFVGVSVFFVLSGFILAYSYGGADFAAYRERYRFWIRRFGRIYPVFAVATCLCVPLFAYYVFRTVPLELALLRCVVVVLLTFALVQSWMPFALGQLNAPSWSLAVEAFLYACFPLLMPRLRNIRGRSLFGVFWGFWAIACVSPLLLSHWQPGIDEWLDRVWPSWARSHYPLFQVFVDAFPIFHLPQFLIGVLGGFFLLRHGPIRLPGGPLMPASCAVIILSLPWIPGASALNQGLLAPLWVLLFLSLAGSRGLVGSTLANPVLVLLGEASYALYIFQDPVRSWVFHACQAVGVPSTGRTFFLVFLVVLVAVSAIAHREDARWRPRLVKWLDGRFGVASSGRSAPNVQATPAAAGAGN